MKWKNPTDSKLEAMVRHRQSHGLRIVDQAYGYARSFFSWSTSMWRFSADCGSPADVLNRHPRSED